MAQTMPTVTDWIQAGAAAASFVTLIVLAVITWWYAKQTREIAKAAEKQADASLRMAQEMEETRELEYRPELALWRVPLKIKKEYTILKVENVGNGPTIDIKVEGWWQGYYYKYDAVSALSSKEIREYTCVASEPVPPLPEDKDAKSAFIVRLEWRNLSGNKKFERVHSVTEEELKIGGAEIDPEIYLERHIRNSREPNQ